MTLQVNDLGADNEIDISAEVLNQGTGMITIAGDRSRLVISSGSLLAGASIYVGSDCHVEIDRSRLAASEIHCVAGASILIGKGCSFTWRTQVLAHERGRIRIGPACLFATETLITLSDMHSIVDLASGIRVNPARDVDIGAHVWIGFRAMILKGASIGEGAVVGAGSIVAGNIPAGCLAAGNPARVLRQAIAWTADLI